MDNTVQIAVEGPTDAAVLKRLLVEVGLEPGPEYVSGGKAALDRRLPGYNNAAKFSCWLVLRDLDRDDDCPVMLRQQLLPRPSAHMRLQIAAHAVESWLLADDQSFSRFFAVKGARVPNEPDNLRKPKETLVNLVRHSQSRTMRDAIVPPPDTTARVGPGYTVVITRFVNDHWRPAVAEKRSGSLMNLRRFLRGHRVKHGQRSP